MKFKQQQIFSNRIIKKIDMLEKQVLNLFLPYFSSKKLKHFSVKELFLLDYYFDTLFNLKWWDERGLLYLIERELHLTNKSTEQINLIIENDFSKQYFNELDKKYGELEITYNTLSRLIESEEVDKDTELAIKLSNEDKRTVQEDFFGTLDITKSLHQLLLRQLTYMEKNWHKSCHENSKKEYLEINKAKELIIKKDYKVFLLFFKEHYENWWS